MENIVPFILGVIIIVIGILNMKGDIRSLHKYHRHRVAPEDVRAYGRLIGLGTVLNGAGISFFGIFSTVAHIISLPLLVTVGSALLIGGVVSGLIIMIIAMVKYNKGIF
jgi:hypothetical protein